MSSKAHADRLGRAIEQTGYAQAVNTAYAADRINVLCRVSAENKVKWLDLVRRMLLAADNESREAHAWAIHICQHFFLKEVEGSDERKLVYGWNVSIQSNLMTESLDYLIRTIKGEKPPERPKHEVMEMEFTGLTKDRNVPKDPRKDRGAFTVGSTKGTDFKPDFRGR